MEKEYSVKLPKFFYNTMKFTAAVNQTEPRNGEDFQVESDEKFLPVCVSVSVCGQKHAWTESVYAD